MKKAEHGKEWRYRNGCRCQKCVQGNYERNRKLVVKAVPGMSLCHRHVDWVAVERATSGDRIPLGVLERRQAVAILDKRGMSANMIAQILGCSDRTVVRIRGRLRV